MLYHYVKGHSDTAFSAKPYSTAKFRPGFCCLYLKKFIYLQAAKLRSWNYYFFLMNANRIAFVFGIVALKDHVL